MNLEDSAQASDREYERHRDNKTKKEYLADGVYAHLDGESLVLTTENGIKITNRIYLDFEVMSALIAYINRHNEHFILQVISK